MKRRNINRVPQKEPKSKLKQPNLLGFLRNTDDTNADSAETSSAASDADTSETG